MMTTKTAALKELPDDPDMRAVKIKDWFPVEVRHLECGGVAFYYRTTPVRGREFLPEEAVYLSGATPTDLHPNVTCGSCGESVPAGELYWRGKT